eukprot:TRINITY_DN828_c0_g1_i3.p1 TRINITY_DN828_c0_g1~~TRINITY_DN828_c0_g1_i3.p1  ORF type:complete len:3031 (+),score=1352.39 TRINITY_DN828_c0_g1_i3:124-9216(+)
MWRAAPLGRYLGVSRLAVPSVSGFSARLPKLAPPTARPLASEAEAAESDVAGKDSKQSRPRSRGHRMSIPEGPPNAPPDLPPVTAQLRGRLGRDEPVDDVDEDDLDDDDDVDGLDVDDDDLRDENDFDDDLNEDDGHRDADEIRRALDEGELADRYVPEQIVTFPEPLTVWPAQLPADHIESAAEFERLMTVVTHYPDPPVKTVMSVETGEDDDFDLDEVMKDEKFMRVMNGEVPLDLTPPPSDNPAEFEANKELMRQFGEAFKQIQQFRQQFKAIEDDDRRIAQKDQEEYKDELAAAGQPTDTGGYPMLEEEMEAWQKKQLDARRVWFDEFDQLRDEFEHEQAVAHMRESGRMLKPDNFEHVPPGFALLQHRVDAPLRPAVYLASWLKSVVSVLVTPRDQARAMAVLRVFDRPSVVRQLAYKIVERRQGFVPRSDAQLDLYCGGLAEADLRAELYEVVPHVVETPDLRRWLKPEDVDARLNWLYGQAVARYDEASAADELALYDTEMDHKEAREAAEDAAEERREDGLDEDVDVADRRKLEKKFGRGADDEADGYDDVDEERTKTEAEPEQELSAVQRFADTMGRGVPQRVDAPYAKWTEPDSVRALLGQIPLNADYDFPLRTLYDNFIDEPSKPPPDVQFSMRPAQDRNSHESHLRSFVKERGVLVWTPDLWLSGKNEIQIDLPGPKIVPGLMTIDSDYTTVRMRDAQYRTVWRLNTLETPWTWVNREGEHMPVLKVDEVKRIKALLFSKPGDYVLDPEDGKTVRHYAGTRFCYRTQAERALLVEQARAWNLQHAHWDFKTQGPRPRNPFDDEIAALLVNESVTDSYLKEAGLDFRPEGVRPEEHPELFPPEPARRKVDPLEAAQMENTIITARKAMFEDFAALAEDDVKRTGGMNLPALKKEMAETEEFINAHAEKFFLEPEARTGRARDDVVDPDMAAIVDQTVAGIVAELGVSKEEALAIMTKDQLEPLYETEYIPDDRPDDYFPFKDEFHFEDHRDENGTEIEAEDDEDGELAEGDEDAELDDEELAEEAEDRVDRKDDRGEVDEVDDDADADEVDDGIDVEDIEQLTRDMEGEFDEDEEVDEQEAIRQSLAEEEKPSHDPMLEAIDPTRLHLTEEFVDEADEIYDWAAHDQTGLVNRQRGALLRSLDTRQRPWRWQYADATLAPADPLDLKLTDHEANSIARLFGSGQVAVTDSQFRRLVHERDRVARRLGDGPDAARHLANVSLSVESDGTTVRIDDPRGVIAGRVDTAKQPLTFAHDDRTVERVANPAEVALYQAAVAHAAAQRQSPTTPPTRFVADVTAGLSGRYTRRAEAMKKRIGDIQRLIKLHLDQHRQTLDAEHQQLAEAVKSELRDLNEPLSASTRKVGLLRQAQLADREAARARLELKAKLWDKSSGLSVAQVNTMLNGLRNLGDSGNARGPFGNTRDSGDLVAEYIEGIPRSMKNAVTYGIVIKAYLKDENLGAAEHWYKQMMIDGYTPTSPVVAGILGRLAYLDETGRHNQFTDLIRNNPLDIDLKRLSLEITRLPDRDSKERYLYLVQAAGLPLTTEMLNSVIITMSDKYDIYRMGHLHQFKFEMGPGMLQLADGTNPASVAFRSWLPPFDEDLKEKLQTEQAAWKEYLYPKDPEEQERVGRADGEEGEGGEVDEYGEDEAGEDVDEHDEDNDEDVDEHDEDNDEDVDEIDEDEDEDVDEIDEDDDEDVDEVDEDDDEIDDEEDRDDDEVDINEEDDEDVEIEEDDDDDEDWDDTEPDPAEVDAWVAELERDAGDDAANAEAELEAELDKLLAEAEAERLAAAESGADVKEEKKDEVATEGKAEGEDAGKGLDEDEDLDLEDLDPEEFDEDEEEELAEQDEEELEELIDEDEVPDEEVGYDEWPDDTVGPMVYERLQWERSLEPPNTLNLWNEDAFALLKPNEPVIPFTEYWRDSWEQDELRAELLYVPPWQRIGDLSKADGLYDHERLLWYDLEGRLLDIDRMAQDMSYPARDDGALADLTEDQRRLWLQFEAEDDAHLNKVLDEQEAEDVKWWADQLNVDVETLAEALKDDVDKGQKEPEMTDAEAEVVFQQMLEEWDKTELEDAAEAKEEGVEADDDEDADLEANEDEDADLDEDDDDEDVDLDELDDEEDDKDVLYDPNAVEAASGELEALQSIERGEGAIDFPQEPPPIPRGFEQDVWTQYQRKINRDLRAPRPTWNNDYVRHELGKDGKTILKIDDVGKVVARMDTTQLQPWYFVAEADSTAIEIVRSRSELFFFRWMLEAPAEAAETSRRRQLSMLDDPDFDDAPIRPCVPRLAPDGATALLQVRGPGQRVVGRVDLRQRPFVVVRPDATVEPVTDPVELRSLEWLGRRAALQFVANHQAKEADADALPDIPDIKEITAQALKVDEFLERLQLEAEKRSEQPDAPPLEVDPNDPEAAAIRKDVEEFVEGLGELDALFEQELGPTGKRKAKAGVPAVAEPADSFEPTPDQPDDLEALGGLPEVEYTAETLWAKLRERAFGDANPGDLYRPLMHLTAEEFHLSTRRPLTWYTIGDQWKEPRAEFYQEDDSFDFTEAFSLDNCGIEHVRDPRFMDHARRDPSLPPNFHRLHQFWADEDLEQFLFRRGRADDIDLTDAAYNEDRDAPRPLPMIGLPIHQELITDPHVNKTIGQFSTYRKLRRLIRGELAGPLQEPDEGMSQKERDDFDSNQRMYNEHTGYNPFESEAPLSYAHRAVLRERVDRRNRRVLDKLAAQPYGVRDDWMRFNKDAIQEAYYAGARRALKRPTFEEFVREVHLFQLHYIALNGEEWQFEEDPVKWMKEENEELAETVHTGFFPPALTAEEEVAPINLLNEHDEACEEIEEKLMDDQAALRKRGILPPLEAQLQRFEETRGLLKDANYGVGSASTVAWFRQFPSCAVDKIRNPDRVPRHIQRGMLATAFATSTADVFAKALQNAPPELDFAELIDEKFWVLYKIAKTHSVDALVSQPAIPEAVSTAAAAPRPAPVVEPIDEDEYEEVEAGAEEDEFEEVDEEEQQAPPTKGTSRR